MESMYGVEQFGWLYISSYTALFGSSFAFFKKHYVMSFLQFLIYMTSINFWRLPEYSWRRNLDMLVVKCGVLYQNYLAYNAQNAAIYYPIFWFGVMFYPLSHYLYTYGHKWLSVYSHMALHVIATFGSCILYLGDVPGGNRLLMV